MLEFFVLIVVLVIMALSGFTVLAMVLVSGVFMLLGAIAGMFSLIIKFAPWLLLGWLIYWLFSNRGRGSNSYR